MSPANSNRSSETIIPPFLNTTTTTLSLPRPLPTSWRTIPTAVPKCSGPQSSAPNGESCLLSPISRGGVAAKKRTDAADTAPQRNGSFDLSGCREYVGSRDCVPTITDAPWRAYFARDSGHYALRTPSYLCLPEGKEKRLVGRGAKAMAEQITVYTTGPSCIRCTTHQESADDQRASSSQRSTSERTRRRVPTSSRTWDTPKHPSSSSPTRTTGAASAPTTSTASHNR